MRLLAASVGIWITLTMLGVIFESAWLDSGHESDFETLTTFQVVKTYSVATLKVPGPNPEYFNALFHAMTFNFSFIPDNSTLQIFRWLVFGVIQVALVWSMVELIKTVSP
jgi:hypothetical protein